MKQNKIKQMKEFDIKKAINGERICTRCGYNVRILHVYSESVSVCIELDDGMWAYSEYTHSGRYKCGENASKYDLMMK